MISKLDEHSTELDLFAAKGVPGSMYIAGTDTVSEVTVLQGEVHVVFLTSLIDCCCPGDIHSSNDVVS
jgi:hypothetical protein